MITRVLALAVLLPLCLAAFDPASYEFHAALRPSGQYGLYWSVNRATETLSFAVKVQTTGWVGIGFSSDGLMPGSDVVIGWVDGAGAATFHDLPAQWPWSKCAAWSRSRSRYRSPPLRIPPASLRIRTTSSYDSYRRAHAPDVDGSPAEKRCEGRRLAIYTVDHRAGIGSSSAAAGLRSSRQPQKEGRPLSTEPWPAHACARCLL